MNTSKHKGFVRSFTQQHRGTPAELRAGLERARAQSALHELEAAALVAHRLHGTARMIGLNSLGLLAGALERTIYALHKRPGPLSSPEWELLLSAAAELERLMGDIAERDLQSSASPELLTGLEEVARR